MSKNYISLSLETHLFFARIMKEHSFFLQAGFPCAARGWIERGNIFRQQFEELLQEAVELSRKSGDSFISNSVLASDELVTDYTLPAERMTSELTEVPFHFFLTEQELNMTRAARKDDQKDTSCSRSDTAWQKQPAYTENLRELTMLVHRLNQRALPLIAELINYKENILAEVGRGKLFTFNYPLLIKHILREAKLYHFTIECLVNNRSIPRAGLLGTPEFWNQIMMEHAQFIRGLLDPSEAELIIKANDFALDYRKLLTEAKTQDCLLDKELARKSLKETLKLKQFKEAGARGILKCEITSLILPLLADHVLREANHYIRILKATD